MRPIGSNRGRPPNMERSAGRHKRLIKMEATPLTNCTPLGNLAAVQPQTREVPKPQAYSSFLRPLGWLHYAAWTLVTLAGTLWALLCWVCLGVLMGVVSCRALPEMRVETCLAEPVLEADGGFRFP